MRLRALPLRLVVAAAKKMPSRERRASRRCHRPSLPTAGTESADAAQRGQSTSLSASDAWTSGAEREVRRGVHNLWCFPQNHRQPRVPSNPLPEADHFKSESRCGTQSGGRDTVSIGGACLRPATPTSWRFEAVQRFSRTLAAPPRSELPGVRRPVTGQGGGSRRWKRQEASRTRSCLEAVAISPQLFSISVLPQLLLNRGLTADS